jgi:hypothetical protein
MRTGWIPIVLLAAAGEAFGMEVTAYFTAEGTACTYPAKRIAASIFQKAGVRLLWRKSKPPVAGASQVCIRIALAEGTPEERLPGALAISYPFSGCARTITVFFDRVRTLARGADREAALLGYVLVHEITHVIERMDRHSVAGVMKARWDIDDRLAIFKGRLGFLDEDLFLMRESLAAGFCKPPVLIGRFESGTAVRRE